MKDFIKTYHYIQEDNEHLSLRKLVGLKTDSIFSTTSSFSIATNIKYDSKKPGLDKKMLKLYYLP